MNFTNFNPSKNKPLPIIPFQNFLCPTLCGKRNRWVWIFVEGQQGVCFLGAPEGGHFFPRSVHIPGLHHLSYSLLGYSVTYKSNAIDSFMLSLYKASLESMGFISLRLLIVLKAVKSIKIPWVLSHFIHKIIFCIHACYQISKNIKAIMICTKKLRNTSKDLNDCTNTIFLYYFDKTAVIYRSCALFSLTDRWRLPDLTQNLRQHLLIDTT